MKKSLFFIISCTVFLFSSCEKDFPIKVKGGVINSYIPYEQNQQTQALTLDLPVQNEVFIEFIRKHTNGEITVTSSHSSYLTIDYDSRYDEDDYSRSSSSYSSTTPLFWKDSKGRIRPKNGAEVNNITVNTHDYNEAYGIRITVSVFGSKETKDIFYANYQFQQFYDKFYFNFQRTNEIYRVLNITEKTKQDSLLTNQFPLHTHNMSYSDKGNSLYYYQAVGFTNYIKKFDINSNTTTTLKTLDYHPYFIRAVENSSEFILNNSTNTNILFYNEAGTLQHTISSNNTISNPSATKTGDHYNAVYFERATSTSFKLIQKNGTTTTILSSYVSVPEATAISADGKSIAYIDGSYLYIKHNTQSFKRTRLSMIETIDFNSDGELMVLTNGNLYIAKAGETSISLLYDHTNYVYDATW